METGHGTSLKMDIDHGEDMKVDSGYIHRMDSVRMRGKNSEVRLRKLNG